MSKSKKKTKQTKQTKPNNTTMSFSDLMADLATEEVPELSILDKGEYTFIMNSVKEGEYTHPETGDVSYYLDIVARVVGEEDKKSVFDRVWAPKIADRETDTERFKSSLRRFQAFWQALGFEGIPEEVETTELQGIEFKAVVKVEEGNDDYPEPKNRFQRFTRSV